MKNSSQTQHHRSETKRKEEQKIEEIRKKKKEDAGCRMQEAGSQWNSSRRSNPRIFAMIAKISLGLRKLHNHSENFAILAKLRIFARLTKFR